MQHVRHDLCNAVPGITFAALIYFGPFLRGRQELVRQYPWIMRYYIPLNNSLGEVNSARPAMRRSSLNFRNTYIWTSARYRIILRIRAPRCNENIISANFAGRERVPRDLNLTSFKWRRISAVKRDMTRHGRQHDKWDVLKVLRISWTFDKKPEIRKNDPAIVRFLLVTLSNIITRNEGSLFVYRGKKLIV